MASTDPAAGPLALVIDEDPGEAFTLVKLLRECGYEPQQVFDAEGARNALAEASLRLIYLDDASRRSFPRGFVSEIRRERPDVNVVITVQRGDVSSVVEGMRAGACDCLVKPVDGDQMKQSVANLERDRVLEQEIDALRVRLEIGQQEGRILGTSLGMRRAVDMARRAAAYPVSVLLLGESGTGKELFAEALHAMSPRRSGPFVAVDCAAIPSELVEAELFGHVRGAFTGAQDARQGRLEEANGGTLFLDEIGNLPAQTQVKLLRVIQERELVRVGGRDTLPLDVRLVTATNVNLRRSVNQGEFREDLYHRLAEFVITLPPLRERGADIELLARFFLHRFNHRFRRSVAGFSDEAFARLKAHRWPGNVRELQSAVKQAVILANDTIEVDHLPLALADLPSEPSTPPASFTLPDGVLPLWEVGQAIISEVEKRAIQDALLQTQQDKAKAASLLSIHFKTLYRKMKEYQIA